MRRDEFSRRLMRESTLSADNLIYPLFVIEGKGRREPIQSMPGHRARHASTSWCARRESLAELGIPALALFPVPPTAAKSEDGSEAWNPEGLAQRAVRAVKQGGAAARRDHRRRARSVHDARPGRHHRRRPATW